MEKIEDAKGEGTAHGRIHTGKRSRPGRIGVNFWIDALAFLTFLITAVSGMALMRIHPDEYNTYAGVLNEQMVWGISRFEWLHLHNLIGWVFVALVVVHLVMHWRWVARMCPSASGPGRACTNKQRL